MQHFVKHGGCKCYIRNILSIDFSHKVLLPPSFFHIKSFSLLLIYTKEVKTVLLLVPKLNKINLSMGLSRMDIIENNRAITVTDIFEARLFLCILTTIYICLTLCNKNLFVYELLLLSAVISSVSASWFWETLHKPRRANGLMSSLWISMMSFSKI